MSAPLCFSRPFALLYMEARMDLKDLSADDGPTVRQGIQCPDLPNPKVFVTLGKEVLPM